MNTLTKNPTKARKMAQEIADMRGTHVWLHTTSMQTYFIDYVPEWWTDRDINARRKAGEIIKPTNWP
jgi:hypothetical protein